METTSDLVIQQWQNSENLRHVIDIAAVVMHEHIELPLERLAQMRNVQHAGGVWLDNIGDRVGVPRPSIPSNDDIPFFGFDMAGTGFDQASMYSGRYDFEAPRILLGDAEYRKMVRAVACWRLDSYSLEDIDRGCVCAGLGCTLYDNHNMTFGLFWDADSKVAGDLLTANEYFPKPAGVKFANASTPGARFGFDNSQPAVLDATFTDFTTTAAVDLSFTSGSTTVDVTIAAGTISAQDVATTLNADTAFRALFWASYWDDNLNVSTLARGDDASISVSADDDDFLTSLTFTSTSGSGSDSDNKGFGQGTFATV